MLDQNILITGASSGIGKAFAYEFAARGANVILASRSGNELDKIAIDIEARHGVKAYVFPIDLTLPSAARTLYDAIALEKIRVDILVNNAGYGRIGGFEEYSTDDYANMIQLNIVALVNLCHLYLPEMRARNDGGIINVASMWGLIPIPYASVYSATKNFVVAFSEWLLGELMDTKVRMTCLCPGATESKFSEVANPVRGGRKGGWESAESVVKKAIDGYLAGDCTITTGPSKWSALLLPRMLTRKAVVRMTRNIFKPKTS